MNKDRLAELVSQVLADRDRGLEQPLEEYCAHCPDLLPGLKERLNGAHTPTNVTDPAPALHRPLPQEEKTLVGAPQVAQMLSQAKPKPRRHPAFPDIPGYEVLSELGRGGMGVVYKARHVTLKRTVALKMIKSGMYAGDAELARFRAEAEAAARLHHPNIVQIYEFETHDDRPYFALEYVEGSTLAAYLEGKPQPERDAAGLLEVLARAIHFAHERGVLHRDLKPANILLGASPTLLRGASPESQASTAKSPTPLWPDPVSAASTGGGATGDTLVSDGARLDLPQLGALVPKVTDFGLAKLLETGESAGGAGSDVTPSGAFLGTPGYMAPEQADTGKAAIGPAADVYGLGAILYATLTGRPPFLAATPLETVLQVLEEEPVSPRRLRPALSRDIETICLRCLEKDPARRYASAEALADDLKRYLNHEPILARPAGAVERAIKWARRRPAQAALLGLTVAGVIVLLIMTYWLNAARTQEKKAREIAQEQRREALEQEAKAKQNFELAAEAVEKFLTLISEHPHLKEFDLEDLRMDLLQAAVGFHRKFVERKSDDPDVIAEQGRAFLRLGLIFKELGKPKEALAHYQEAEALFAPLVNAYAERISYRRDWGKSWNRIASVQQDRLAALDAIGRAVWIREEVTHASDARPEDVADLATSLNNQAIFLNESGAAKRAEELFTRAAKLQEGLVSKEGPKSVFQGDLARTHYNLGFFYSNNREPKRAQAEFAEAARLWKDLVEGNPRPGELLVDLAACYGNMAALAETAGQAEKLYLQAEAILRRATERHPSITRYRSMLARTYSNLALKAGSTKESHAYSLKGLTVHEKLVEQHPTAVPLRAALARALEEVAGQSKRLGDEGDARRRLNEALDHRKKILVDQPKNLEQRLALARAYLSLAGLGGVRPDVLSAYENALTEARRNLEISPDHGKSAGLCIETWMTRANYFMAAGDYKNALLDWDEAVMHTPAPAKDVFRLPRALSMAKLRRHEMAGAEAADLMPRVKSGADQYQLARIFALCLAGVEADRAVEESLREPKARLYAGQAVACLKQAQEAGYFKEAERLKQLRADADFESLRKRDDFEAWIASQ